MAKKEEAKTNGTATHEGNMPLFYKKPVPLDKSKHGNLSLAKKFTFDFTKEVNAVPINLVLFLRLTPYVDLLTRQSMDSVPEALVSMSIRRSTRSRSKKKRAARCGSWWKRAGGRAPARSHGGWWWRRRMPGPKSERAVEVPLGAQEQWSHTRHL